MTSLKEKASKIQELVDKGVSMEEALLEVLGEEPERVVIADRVEWISNLNNIAEVRRAIKVAYAKKSKSKGKASEARYEQEIRAGQRRLAELLQIVAGDENPPKKAVELGETTSGVIQVVLDFLGGEVNRELEQIKEAEKLSDKALKAKWSELDSATPEGIVKLLEDLGPEYLEEWEKRVKKGDQRVIAVNKQYRFLKG